MEAHCDEVDATNEIRWLFEEAIDAEEHQFPPKSIADMLWGTTNAIGHVIALASSLCCAQALGGIVPPFELNAWRYLAQFAFVLPIISSKCISLIPEKKDAIWLILVALCYISFNLSYYTSALYLPVGTVGGMLPSMMIIIVTIVTLVLDRQCACHVAVASVTCIVGVLLVTQPEFVFKESSPTARYNPVCSPTTDNLTSNTSSEWGRSLHTTDVHVATGYIWLAGTAVSGSANMFFINKKLNNVSGLATCFWVAVGGVLSQFIAMAIFEQPYVPTNGKCIGLLIGHAVLTGCAFICLTFACQLINPAIVSLLTTLQVGMLFVAQYTIFKSIYPGKSNMLEFIGAALTFVGNVISPAIKVYAFVKQNYYRS